jgi:hypothetical protein
MSCLRRDAIFGFAVALLGCFGAVAAEDNTAAPAPIQDNVPRVIGGGGGAVGGNGRTAFIPYALPAIPDGVAKDAKRAPGAIPDLSGMYEHWLRAWQNVPPSSGVGSNCRAKPMPRATPS